MGVYLPREQDVGWFAEQLWDEIREEWFFQSRLRQLGIGALQASSVEALTALENDPIPGATRGVK